MSNIVARAALCGLAALAPAHAQGDSPKVFEPISRKECGVIFGSAAGTIADLVKGKDTEPAFKGMKWHDAFPRGLARFIAPTKPDAVYKVLIAGNEAFQALARPETPAETEYSREVAKAADCSGPQTNSDR